MPSIFKLDQTQQLEEVKKRKPESMADEVFFEIATEFVRFDMSSSIAQTTKNMNDHVTKLQNMVSASILNEPSKKQVEYWVKTMDVLISKGDYSGSVGIAMELLALESKAKKANADPQLKQAFPPGYVKEALKNLPELKRIDKMNVYNETPTVTIPYMGIYMKISELAKEGKTIGVTDGGGIQNLQNSTYLWQTRLADNLNARKALLITELEQYKQRYEGTKGDVDSKKYKACSQLLNICKNPSSPEIQTQLLEAFIKLAPEILEHKKANSNAEFTLVTIAKELSGLNNVLNEVPKIEQKPIPQASLKDRLQEEKQQDRPVESPKPGESPVSSIN